MSSHPLNSRGADGAPAGRPRLSIVIPVFNEAATIGEIIERVRRAPLDLEREVVVVDDGSTDGTSVELDKLVTAHPGTIRVVTHEHNRGKGAALRSGFACASGDIVLIQDADLEYDPRDYPALLRPILEQRADVVFGNRFHGGEHRVLYYRHFLANRVLTTICNVVTDLNLSDMEVGYKVFRTSVLRRLHLRARGFDIEPELVIKTAKLGVRIYEVPIAYHGRTYAEGKKIGWRDGVVALWRIFVFRVFG